MATALAYEWPVHRIAPDFQPATPPAEPTLLIVWRTRTDNIKFMEINAVTARLMQLLAEDSPATGRELLLQIGHELGHPEPEQVVVQGGEILRGLRARDIVIGTGRAA